MTEIKKVEFSIVIKDGANYYYIQKVEHVGSETLCFYPDAGFHFTEHKSGEAHIRTERNTKNLQEEYPQLLQLVRQEKRSVKASDMKLPKI